MSPHTVTLKDEVFEGLKAIRYELSSTKRIITFSEAVGELVKQYQSKISEQPDRS